MVDPDAVSVDVEAFKHFEDGLGAVSLVGQMRGVNQNQLVVFHSQFNVRLKRVDLILSGLVKTGFPDTETSRFLEEFRHRAQHIFCQLRVLGFFGI